MGRRNDIKGRSYNKFYILMVIALILTFILGSIYFEASMNGETLIEKFFSFIGDFILGLL